MMKSLACLQWIVLLGLQACVNQKNNSQISERPYKVVKSIHYNGVKVDIIIDKPAGEPTDVLMVYHGTVVADKKILDATETTLQNFRKILRHKNTTIISVAYPEEGLLIGDNLPQAEAALLWVKNKANAELGIPTKKIFLAGHSQGGYLVTRLNRLHSVNGVIANAPGPLNLAYRCQLEEKRQIKSSAACTLLYNQYGFASDNPEPYLDRSLLKFTSGFKSDILFIQGLHDSPVQMYSWQTFKQNLMNCSDCKETQFFEVKNEGHLALFNDNQAIELFNNFLNTR
ncbi:MAG: prolyl oligopeptidase family serine peptidase [Chitinophagaceae bacterium]|jgi:hypothetical protein|nr:prolyl oligopeptidase family serine peptidase [Chitinophagaceae bacterium]